jgi:hypothetical protein
LPLRGLPRGALLVTTAVLMTTSHGWAAAPDHLAEGFVDPPNSAHPRVWWHWMNGNITQDGIDKDLDWMKRVGLGGAQAFDVALATPQIVDKRLAYM